MKLNLKDVTFLIPVRLDSIDRLMNLKVVTQFLVHCFDTNIKILDADKIDRNLIRSVVPKGVDVQFIYDVDTIFYRTLYIDKMVKECETPFLTVWDSDVLAPPQQILKAVELLRTGHADFTYPYEFKFLDVPPIIKEMFFAAPNFAFLERNQKKMKEMYAPRPVGGAFFASKERYIQSGIENLNFYGWGVEDGERITRWKRLGLAVERVHGTLYHLSHARGLNSTFASNSQKSDKMHHYSGIVHKTKAEMESEVASWNK